MKVEMNFFERADYANLQRARASRLRELAEDRTMSAVKEELLAEAKWREERARKLDDAIEDRVSEREPIRLDAKGNRVEPPPSPAPAEGAES